MIYSHNKDTLERIFKQEFTGWAQVKAVIVQEKAHASAMLFLNLKKPDYHHNTNSSVMVTTNAMVKIISLYCQQILSCDKLQTPADQFWLGKPHLFHDR